MSCLDPTLSTLPYSTYVGSTGEDAVWGVAVNDEGDLVVNGFARHGSFPTTTGAYRTTWGGGGTDVVVFVLRPGGMGSQDLRYSTFLGDTVTSFPGAIAVEGLGGIVRAHHAGTPGQAATLQDDLPCFFRQTSSASGRRR